MTDDEALRAITATAIRAERRTAQRLEMADAHVAYLEKRLENLRVSVTVLAKQIADHASAASEAGHCQPCQTCQDLVGDALRESK
jgi:hypothetical protein